MKITTRLYPLFLSLDRKQQFERLVFAAAIVAFMLHFVLIVAGNWGWLPAWLQGEGGARYINPIVSIYTPFTIILLYEIYSLIYYLPKSINIYLGKQYEIVALIFIRKIFNDLGKLSSGDLDAAPGQLWSLLLSFVGLIVLLLLIYCFYRLGGSRKTEVDERRCKTRAELRFVATKKAFSLGLIVVFIYLFAGSLLAIERGDISVNRIVHTLTRVNAVFFDQFFTALILVEVLLLLTTFSLSHHFNKVVRNSGFIISTILLKLSFRAEGATNVGIILLAVGFGVGVLGVYRVFEEGS